MVLRNAMNIILVNVELIIKAKMCINQSVSSWIYCCLITPSRRSITCWRRFDTWLIIPFKGFLSESISILLLYPPLLSSILSLKCSRLISKFHLPISVTMSLLHTLKILLVIVQETQLMINIPPFWVKLMSLFFINIIVVISFFDIVASFFPNNFSAFVIEHPFFGNSIDSEIVPVGLLLLRNGLSSFVLASIVLVIVFSYHFPIWPNLWWTHKALADIGTLYTFAVKVLVNWIKKELLSENLNMSSKGSLLKFIRSPKNGSEPRPPKPIIIWSICLKGSILWNLWIWPSFLCLRLLLLTLI